MSDLNERVSAAASGALQATPKGQAPSTVWDLVRSKREVLEAALPKHLTADRYLQVVLNQIRKNAELQVCDPQSLLGAIYALAQVGLEPDGRNAHLVPFRDKKKPLKQVQPIIDYRGYIELAMRSGRVKDIYAEVVHEKDHFVETKGLQRDLVHRPYDGDDDPGPLVASYAVINYTAGGYAYVVLRRRDIAKRRSSSKTTSDFGPWAQWEEGMWLKSAIRALAKFMPYSPEIARAETVDRAVDNGVNIIDGDVIDVLQIDTRAGELVEAEATEPAELNSAEQETAS